MDLQPPKYALYLTKIQLFVKQIRKKHLRGGVKTSHCKLNILVGEDELTPPAMKIIKKGVPPEAELP
jgi:hypothetical protein